MDAALEDVTIADFTQMMQGPWATQKLADFGADVVKIEPLGGEWERQAAAAGDAFCNGESPFFLAMNRNKRSVTLDLKDERGHEAALRIAADTDVVIENFRPGTMDRLGLGYEDVRAENEDVVHVSASGFGPDGPYVDRPGQDLLLQAMSGLTMTTGRKDDPPTPVGTPVVDEHAASLIATYTAVALFHRERTGEGQFVEVNLLDAAVDMQCQEVTASLNLDEEFERSEAGIAFQYLGAPYGIYETADGHVAIAMSPLETIAEVIGADDLREYEDAQAAYEHRDEIKRTLEVHTCEWSTDDLLDALLDEDVWVAPVNDFHEMAADPQVRHNDMIVEVEHPEGGTFETTGIPGSFSETPGEIRMRPPQPGEHTTDVLREHGYDETQIQELAADGVTEAN